MIAREGVDVEELLEQLVVARDEIARLERVVGRPPSPANSSSGSSASFATITSSSASGGAADGVTSKRKKPVASVYDEALLPTPALVAGRAYEEPSVTCADVLSSKELSALQCSFV